MLEIQERKPFINRLSRQAREKYNTLAPNLQEMYRLERCSIGGEKMPATQTNVVIMEGLPPVCKKHLEPLKQEVSKLAPLLQQLKLS